MRNLVALGMLAVAVIAAGFALFGDDSYQRLQALKLSLEAQQKKNSELERRVDELRAQVEGIHQDKRALEKAARNELGLARPNELIFLFEKKAK